MVLSSLYIVGLGRSVAGKEFTNRAMLRGLVSSITSRSSAKDSGVTAISAGLALVVGNSINQLCASGKLMQGLVLAGSTLRKCTKTNCERARCK